MKFTPAGGRVRVSLEPGVRELTLTVSDSGKGIATEFLPFAFDMFRQADSSTTREHDGLGLGLAVARKLVELHGGRIRAESEGVDKGATFSVTLPLQTVQARPEQQGGSEISNAQAGTLEGSRILVVEDHSDSREALAELLWRLGAITVTAESAQEALTAIGRQVPDVLISDIAMPRRDGFALMQSLNEHPAKKAGRIVSIALTGLSDPQHARRALQEGFDVCMVKPLDLGRLIEYVASAVRRIAEQSK